ncbi:hypothetical protein GCM10027442_37600 [Emticicia fontis]
MTTKSVVDKTTTIKNLEIKKSIHEFFAIMSVKDTVYMLKTAFLINYPKKASLESLELKLLAKDEELRQFTCKINQENTFGLLIECPINKQDFPFLTKPMSYVKLGDDNRFEYSLEKKSNWSDWYDGIQNSANCIATELKLPH